MARSKNQEEDGSKEGRRGGWSLPKAKYIFSTSGGCGGGETGGSLMNVICYPCAFRGLIISSIS